MLFASPNSDDIEMLTRSPNLIPLASKSARKLMLEKDGSYIRYIRAPSLQEQAIAVRDNPYNIQYINKPDLSIALSVVEQKSSAIKYITEPTEEMYDMVFNDAIESLKCIKTLSRFKLLYKVAKALFSKSTES